MGQSYSESKTHESQSQHAQSGKQPTPPHKKPEGAHVQKKQNYTDIHELIEQKQLICQWHAPLRAYKKQSKHVLRFYVALATILSVIVFFFQDYIVLMVIWSMLFLFYQLTVTPPPVVTNKITAFGVESGGVQLRWEVLSHFYFTKRFEFEILTLVTQGPYPFFSYFVIPDQKTKEEVMHVLSEYIMFVPDPPITITDRLINLMSQLIPTDDEEESTTPESQDSSQKKKQSKNPSVSVPHQKSQVASL